MIKSSAAGGRIAVRESNIELLRIIIMICVVANHFVSHSGLTVADSGFSANTLWVQLLKIGGKISVDIFVLISGYFSITSQKKVTAKAARMWLQLFTYSAGIFAVFCLAGLQPFSIKEMIKHIMPVTFANWWFASTFFVMLLFTPYINKLFLALGRNAHKGLIALMGICWSVIPTFTAHDFEGNALIWFIFLYSSAAYLRLYDPFEKVKKSTCFIPAALLIMLTLASSVILNYAGAKYPALKAHQYYFFSMQRVNIFLVAVLLLAGFSKINIGKNKIINLIASATFGVYLIHDEKLMRPFLWDRLFKVNEYSESKMLIPYSIAVILLVFISCIVIELIRANTLEKLYMKPVGAAVEKFEKATQKIINTNSYFKRKNER